MHLIDFARHATLRWTLRQIMELKHKKCSIQLGEIELAIPEYVSHPCPIPLLNFFSLFRASVKHIQEHERVLEMGAGAGVWSILCAQQGAHVFATDLPSIPLTHLIKANAHLKSSIKVFQGDLFSALSSQERFDHIFFNPPFHLAIPKAEWERAYFGGTNGEVLTRFLKEAPQWLTERGRIWICIPDREQSRYTTELRTFRKEIIKTKWLPLLGSVRLLSLRPRSLPFIDGERITVLNPVAESFWHLSKLMNTQSAELITLRGTVNEERLKQSIHQVCSQHPLITARLEARGRLRPIWRAQPSVYPELRSFHVPIGSTGFDQEQEIWRGALPDILREQVWGKTVLDPQTESPVRFVLIWEGEWSHIMIIAPHLCTDAHAGAHLLADLLLAYTQTLSSETKACSNLPYFEEDPLALSHLSRTQVALLLFKAITRLFKDLCTRGEGVTDVSHRVPRGQTSLSISPRDPEELSRMLRVAKKSGLTAHLLLTRALIHREQKKRSKVSNTLRLADLIALSPMYPKIKRDQMLKSFDVFVLPHVVNHDLSESDQQYYQRFSEELKSLKEGEAFAELYRLRFYNFFARLSPIHIVSSVLFRYILKTTTTTTNPGSVRAQLERCGDHEVLDFINFPQLSPPARLGIIYTTFKGRLRLLILHDEAQITHSEAMQLADELWEEVLSLTRRLEESQNSI